VIEPALHQMGKSKPHLSAEDLVSCCGFWCGMGCNGGYPTGAWSYWVTKGIVSGGNYGSKGDEIGCYPYQVESCDHHTNGTLPPCGPSVETPACNKTCQDGQSWQKDKHFGLNSYSVLNNVKQIQTEIMDHGPVEAAFLVYSDFLLYKSGVYHRVAGDFFGRPCCQSFGMGN